ncbi:hypothetical protein N9D31_02675 [Oligoflexaceae bacterium]|nr:hypothetical protein [Oligoflexaceae bacterium]
MKVYLALFALVLTSESFAASVTTAHFQLRPKDDQTTYKDIKPILDVHCVRCHSGPTPRANLSLAQFPFTKNGSNSSQMQAAVVTRMIARATNEEKPMPPRQSPFPRLDEDQVNLLRAWLDDGLLIQKDSLFVIQTTVYNDEGEIVSEDEIVFEENPFAAEERIEFE